MVRLVFSSWPQTLEETKNLVVGGTLRYDPGISSLTVMLGSRVSQDFEFETGSECNLSKMGLQISV